TAGNGIAEFGRNQLVLDPGRPGRDMVQTIVTHRRNSFSCEKPGWLSASTSRRRVSSAGCCPDLPAMSPSPHPGIPPDDSQQEANITHFMDCSEAQCALSWTTIFASMTRHDGCWQEICVMELKPSSVMNSRLFMCGWPPPGKRSFGVQ